jgi:hypothetical protein
MGSATKARQDKGAIAREKAELDRTLYFVDGYEAAADKAGGAGDEIRRLVKEQIEGSPPLRVRFVRDLLEISDHTVVDWSKLGILEERDSKPRRISLLSVLMTKRALDDVRAAGRNRDLTSAVLNKLELEELREDRRFGESLAQAKRGQRGEWPEGF